MNKFFTWASVLLGKCISCVLCQTYTAFMCLLPQRDDDKCVKNTEMVEHLTCQSERNENLSLEKFQ